MTTAPKLFSKDPVTGVTKWFHWDDTNDTFVIQTQQEVDNIIDANRMNYNESANESWGDGKVVASIPMTVYFDLMKKGIANDPKALKKWLNDPDNRYFRTRAGHI